MKKLIASLILVALIWGVWLTIFESQLQAQTSSSWLDNDPTLGQREDMATNQLPESLAFAGNIPCSLTQFTIKPAIPQLQTAETASACAVVTPQGKTASGGFTSTFKVGARLYNSGGGPVNFYAVPGSFSGVVLESTAQGTRLHYYSSGVLAARKEFNPYTRELRVYLPATPNWTLKDKSGKVLHVQPESITFSSNGQWMVAESAFLATMIVNLSTGEVVPFSAPYSYHLGLSVTPHLAVSDDGKTVVKTSDRGDFKVTDISSCAGVPSVIVGPVTCSSASHEVYLRSKIPGYFRIYQPRFLNDRRISFYASYNTSPPTRALAKFRMAPVGDSLENQDYLALGDSFVSGEGAYDYFSETDTTANMCHLSRRSYPYLVGQQMSLQSYNSVACSGAKVQDITTYVQKRNIPSPNTMGRLLPGFKKQIQYIGDQNPNVVTVGVGGNDIGFGDLVKKCVGVFEAPETCYRSYEDRLELVRLVNKQHDQLVDLYGQLKNAIRKDAKLYVIGYPQIAKSGGNCALNVRLDNQEIDFSNLAIDYLNKVIELSANKAGVRYVDVTNAFAGHRMCETSSDLMAFNGVTLGSDKFGIIGNESYHPNKLGHQLYKQLILAQTSNFSQPSPSPNAALKLPGEDSGLDILNAPKSDRQVYETNHDETIADNTILRGSSAIQINSEKHLLQPSSSIRVELHSTPLSLGTFRADNTGKLSTMITIPPSTPPGFHTLHIFGVDITGSPVDIYKTVYIAAAANDYDGDAIVNSIDECIGLPDSGTDTDGDGVDDVCDQNVEVKAIANTSSSQVNTAAHQADTLAHEVLQDSAAAQPSLLVGAVHPHYTKRWPWLLIFPISAAIATFIYKRLRK